MPAPLDIDREAVKAHAITYGLNDAARAFGIPQSTVGSWSERDPEGPWCPRVLKQVAVQRPPTVTPRAIGAIKPSVAARNSLQELGGKIRLKAAKVAKKGLDHAHKLNGEAIIERASGLKALVDMGEKAVGWANQPSVPTLRLELIANAVAEELPVIDVESDVLPVPSTELHEG